MVPVEQQKSWESLLRVHMQASGCESSKYEDGHGREKHGAKQTARGRSVTFLSLHFHHVDADA